MFEKRHYIKIATEISYYKTETERNTFINFLIPIFKRDNYLFDENKFKEFINKEANYKNMKQNI